MRNLLLLGAAFGLATTASAQSNTADVEQTGSSHSADIDQTGSSNDADVLQSGTGNILDLVQNGAGNEAFVTQTTDPSRAGVSADVNQSGTSQYAEVEQTGTSPGAYAEVKQDDGSGTGNNAAYITQQRSQDGATSLIHQSGSGNTATNFQDAGGINQSYIYQGQTDGASSGNIASVTQDRSAPGPDASAFKAIANVYQDGTANDANVNQSLSANAQATIDQDGTSNVADVDQWNTIGIDPSHQASITQAGEFNFGRIEQGGDATAASSATIQQTGGDSNAAFIDQEGLGGGHMATAIQSGDNNRVEGLGGLGTAALQSGTGHTFMVTQGGLGSNVAQISQTGDLGHSATISQDGSTNTVSVTQQD